MRIDRLCEACLAKEYDRIEAACKHNADKSVDWWVEYWTKAQERQLKTIREHCNGQ